MKMEDKMKAGIRVCENWVELEFCLEEVEFGCGQDWPVWRKNEDLRSLF